MSELPCDCEPSTSFYLTLPPRTFAEAVRDVSKVRDLPTWVYDLLRDTRPSATVVCLATARAQRRRR